MSPKEAALTMLVFGGAFLAFAVGALSFPLWLAFGEFIGLVITCLMAATFYGLRFYWFERFITVPFVKLVHLFSNDVAHKQYLQKWELRK